MVSDPEKPTQFLTERARSFKHAFDGWGFMLRTQRNAWIHFAATVAVVLVSLWLKLNLLEWAVILLVIGMVWTAEFLNTALEAIVDLASPDNHPLAKVGKDLGAGAVLVSAFIALVIGILILGPALWVRLGL